MSQTLTLKIKLNPTSEQIQLLKSSSQSYIETVNSLVSEMVEAKATTKKSSKDIDSLLNSSVKKQVIRDAKSVYKKAKNTKYETIPVLKKKAIIWNNQNFSVEFKTISMPFIMTKTIKSVEKLSTSPLRSELE
jgi:putative transposase